MLKLAGKTIAAMALAATLGAGCTLRLKPQSDVFYDAILEAQPGNEFVLYAQGRNLLDQGQFAQARKAFADFTRQYPRRASGWAALGQCELGLKEYGSAESAFMKALAVESSLTCEAGLISALVFQGKIADAEVRIAEASGKYGENAVLMRLKGDLALFAENYKEAVDFYRRSLKINPNQADLKRRVEDLKRFSGPRP